MASIYEMKQDRAALTKSMRDLMDKHDGVALSAESATSMKKMEEDFDSLSASIEVEQRQLNRERIAEGSANAAAKPVAPKNKLWTRALQGDSGAIANFRNEMTLGADATAGSLTAPMEFVNTLIQGLDNELFMRRIAFNVGPIGAAQSLGFPMIKTDASDATWTTEVAQSSEETTLDFARREFKPNRLSKRVKISNTLIRHSQNADALVLSRILAKISMAQESAYMTGDGAGKPLGIFTASANGIATDRDIVEGSTATAITADSFIAAKYAVKGQYQRRANWIMHRDLCKMVAKLKDNEGQYIWQPSIIMGQPDMLLGAPVNMSEYAPNTLTAGKYVAVFGDCNNYWFCDADELYVKVLNELYAENNEIGYIVDYFGDGAPVLGEAFSRLKLASV